MIDHQIFTVSLDILSKRHEALCQLAVPTAQDIEERKLVFQEIMYRTKDSGSV